MYLYNILLIMMMYLYHGGKKRCAFFPFAYIASRPCSAVQRGAWACCKCMRLWLMDAFGGRDAELACVWRHGAGERRRWEEGAINTQGVCAYLSRTIKWENGINALTMDLADMLLLKLLLLACLPGHNQGECGGLGTARKRAQVVLLKSAKRRMRGARKAASAVS